MEVPKNECFIREIPIKIDDMDDFHRFWSFFSLELPWLSVFSKGSPGIGFTRFGGMQPTIPKQVGRWYVLVTGEEPQVITWCYDYVMVHNYFSYRL